MAIFNVANAAGLQAALSRAVGGDRIVLAPGDYGTVRINNARFASPVTIVSAGNPGDASFDGLHVRHSSNLTFQALDLGRELEPGEGIYTLLNSVRNSSNIRMLGVKLHGSEDGNPANDGQGLIVSDTTNFRFDHSEVTSLTRGVYVERSTNVTFANNELHNVRMDGLAIASTNTLFALNNVFRNFRPQPGDHADAIQLWNTNQTRGSANILIRDNVVWMPEEQSEGTAGVQGIWIADPGAHGYQNVWIRNNLVYSNDIWNGISVFGGRSVEVSNNSLLSRSDDGERLWLRLEGGWGHRVFNNVTEDVILNGVTPSLSNNLNLRQTPDMRRLFADLNSPDALQDLVVPGRGFQLGGAVPRFTPAREDLFDVREAADLDLGAYGGPDTIMSAAMAVTAVVEAPAAEPFPLPIATLSADPFVALP